MDVRARRESDTIHNTQLSQRRGIYCVGGTGIGDVERFGRWIGFLAPSELRL